MLAHFRRQGVAYLALFVALSGTGYAAANLPKNSVSSKQVKNGSITTKDIKDGTVAETDLAAGVAGVPGPAGSAGLPGLTGPVGPVFGTSANNGANTTPDNTTGVVAFTIPVAGKVFMSLGFQILGATCSAAGTWSGQLVVDGVLVPGSRLNNETSGTNLKDVVTMGVSPSVLAAGSHTVSYGFDCASGTVTGSSVAFTGISTVVLGS